MISNESITKELRMNGYQGGFFAALAITLGAQCATERSAVATKKPKINFYGTIIDAAGNTYNAKNITIAGAYKNIGMYMPPAKPDMIPSHRINIDLAEEKEIRVVYKEQNPDIRTYKGREYIVLEVTPRQSNIKGTCIVPRHTKVAFDEPISDIDAREHETTFQEINHVLIAGMQELKTNVATRQRTGNYMPLKRSNIIL